MLYRAINPILSFFDRNGHPLAGGVLCTFMDGENTPIATYKDENGTLNPPVITLDVFGSAKVFLDPAVTYRYEVKDKNGVTQYTFTGVTSNTKTFQAVGSDTIEATEATVDGKTVVTFKVKAGSVGREELKNPRMLLDDGETTELVHKIMDGVEYVVVKAVVPRPSGTETMTLKYADGEVKWVADV